MSTFAQLRDCGEDPIVIFEELFHTALGKLLPELAKAPWYVREREVVNLFVFGHLIPQFQKKNLDISQLGIEVAVQKLPKIIEAESDGAKSSKQAREMLGRYADIVVWPHAEATLWQTCKPLVQVEWKHISCRTERPPDIKKGHEDDIRLLQHNRSLVCVSYAVLTEWHMDQRERYVEVSCKRIGVVKESGDFWSRKVAATCSESEIAVLQGPHEKVRSRPQACPVCIPQPSA